MGVRWGQFGREFERVKKKTKNYEEAMKLAEKKSKVRKGPGLPKLTWEQVKRWRRIREWRKRLRRKKGK